MVSLNHPNYEPEGWHATLIVIAVLLLSGLMNLYAFWLVPWIELFSGVGHICCFVIFVVVLITMGPRYSARFIFFESSISSGWNYKSSAGTLGCWPVPGLSLVS